MAMKKVGLIGWRGMVGSVLVQRMQQENDFADIDPVFFSTSRAGGSGPDFGNGPTQVLDANDIAQLKRADILMACQGSD
jgi:aspartate-semialdehyde dehydrogenase